MKIQIIVGSTRDGRMTERVARWVERTAQNQPDFEVEYVDLADFDLPMFDEAISPRYNPNRQPAGAVAKWLDAVAQADGYVVVTPEYNHSISAVLKNALDYVDFQFVKKPVAIVSHGTVGGARAAEHLKAILIEMKAAVVPEAVAFMGRPNAALNEDGSPTHEISEAATAGLNGTLTELAWWTNTLAAGRAVVAK